jgi:hypothetical protein
MDMGTKIAANIADLDPTRTADISVLANSVLNRIPYFLGGLALLAILYSGFMYMTAYGDAAKMEQAKKNITWTVVGIIVVAALTIIINLILRIVFEVLN